MNKLRAQKSEVFYKNIVSLHMSDWSLQDIADSFSVSKSAVADWEKKGKKFLEDSQEEVLDTVPINEKKAKSLSKEPKPVQVVLSMSDQQEILKLAQMASKVSRNTPADAPSRKAAAKLESILVYHRARGISYGKLAAAAGVTRRAIAQRLEKHKDQK